MYNVIVRSVGRMTILSDLRRIGCYSGIRCCRGGCCRVRCYRGFQHGFHIHPEGVHVVLATTQSKTLEDVVRAIYSQFAVIFSVIVLTKLRNDVKIALIS